MNVDVPVDIELFKNISKDLRFLLLYYKNPGELKAICQADKYFANLCRDKNFRTNYMKKWNTIEIEATDKKFFTKEKSPQRKQWVQQQIFYYSGLFAHTESRSQKRTGKVYTHYYIENDDLFKKEIARFKTTKDGVFLVITPFKRPQKQSMTAFSRFMVKKIVESGTIDMPLI